MRILSDIERFSEAVGLIYAAGLDPVRWRDVIARLHLDAGGTAVHIFGYDFDSGTDLGFITAGYDDDYLRSYGEHYCHRNPWSAGWMQIGSGQPTYSQQMCPRDELRTTDFYHEWVRPQEDLLAGGGVLFHKTQHRMFALGGNIRRKDEDALEDSWMHLVNLLKPHLARAFGMNRDLMGRSLVETLAAPVHGGARIAALVVNERGQLIYASDMATELLVKGDVFRCDAMNRVALVDAGAELTFCQALCALQSNPIPPALSYKSQQAHIRRSYEFIAFNGAFSGGASTSFDISPIFGADETCLLVTLTEDTTDRSIACELKQAYQLTATEAEVALMLADGLPTREIAELRSVNITTVRNQIKAAMTKCGVRRQLDMIRLVERQRQRQPTP